MKTLSGEFLEGFRDLYAAIERDDIEVTTYHYHVDGAASTLMLQWSTK